MEKLLECLRTADNGTWVDGYGHIVGYDQVRVVRAMAELITASMAQSAQPLALPLESALKFNVIRYFHNGIKLEKPELLFNVAVHQHNRQEAVPQLTCYAVINGVAVTYLELDTIVSTSFKCQGIWVEGLQLTMAAPTPAGGYALPMLRPKDMQLPVAQTALAHETKWRATYTYQRLLLTSIDHDELERNNYFYP